MAVAIVLTGKQDLRLVHWAARLAKGRQQGLVLLWSRQRRGDAKRTSSRGERTVPDELESLSNDLTSGNFELFTDGLLELHAGLAGAKPKLPLEVISICSPEIHCDVVREIESLDVECLILPREPQLRSGTDDTKLHDYVLEHVPCEVVLLTPGAKEDGQCRGIVTPVGEGPHSASCLRMANAIANVSDARLKALHVEPPVDVVANQAAERILSKTLDRALGSSQDLVDKHIVLSNNVLEGINQAVDGSTDLIVLGMKRVGVVRRFSSQGLAEKLVNSNPDATVAVVQSAIPLSSQIERGFQRILTGVVPQLPREQRVSLVERIQRSSQWDFDFILLICMSTMIAAGGLIVNSAAVVIGAMLVAPLMTPLLGTGLSITQGNLVQFRHTLYTVLKGFLLAFFIGLLVGIFAADRVTPEMAARGNPTTLDIVVAMVGGIAAAYASGRPNLLSALPGVAIAAALVPPIATSGIATWLGEFSLAGRAALLFFTNIVAIILGTWIAFRATGIRSAHEHGEYDRWTIGAAASLVALCIGLGIYESSPSGQRTANLLQTRLNKLADQDRWICTDVEYGYGEDGRRIASVHLESPYPLTEERLQSIRKEVLEAHDEPPRVRFVTTTE